MQTIKKGATIGPLFVISSHNIVDGSLSVTVCRESYNEIPVGFLTQTAGGTANVLVDSCRASDNFTTAASFIETVDLVRLDNSNSGDVVLCHHSIRHFHVLCRSVNRESFCVSFLDNLQVVAVESVVGVSVTLTATVSVSEPSNSLAINITEGMGQVACYIVAPQLATAKLANLREKLLETNTTLALSYSFPVYILGATFSVATFIVERAGGGAGFPAAGGGGDWASLAVAADQGESDVHCLGWWWEALSPPVVCIVAPPGVPVKGSGSVAQLAHPSKVYTPVGVIVDRNPEEVAPIV